MGDWGVKERPCECAKTGESSGNLMDATIGSEALLKKSEFIRIIIDALFSLGFDGIAADLEKQSGVDLHNSTTKQFLELVKHGEWDKSIDALQGFELRDEKAVRFLLLEQKFLEFLKNQNDKDALTTIREEMAPLGFNRKRIHKLASKFLESASGEDTKSVKPWSTEVVKKLQELFPPAIIMPERRLEYLLEKTLIRQRYCGFHNIPDTDLSLCSDHYYCGKQKIPSKTIQILPEHTDEVWFLKFSHIGKHLASSSKDKSAIIWEINAEGKFLMKHKLVGHEKPVVAVLWSPDDQQVITCGENEVIRRWDVSSGQCAQVYEINGAGSFSCGWLHDGSGIIGAMADRRIYLWNLDGTMLEHEQEERAQKLSDVAMTTDGKWLVSVGRKQHEISLFDRETRAKTLIQMDDMITSFSLSKDNKFLLINLITQEIHLWYIDGEPRNVSVFDGHKRSRFIIRSCFGGFEENFIASGSEDSQVYIWHGGEGRKPCCVLSGHAGAVNCVSWNPSDLHMLASASDDGTIRIWGLDEKLN